MSTDKPANRIVSYPTLPRSPLARATSRLMRSTFAVGLIVLFGSAAPARNVTGDVSASAAFKITSVPVVPIHHLPQAGSHRREDYCGVCEDFIEGGRYLHQAMQFLLPKTGDGPGKDEDPQWHPEELKPGDCLQVHGICTSGGGTAEAHAAGELRAQVAAAAALRDVATLVRLVDLPSVAVVPERTAIQVIGCDGQTVVGHVPVERDILIELQAVRSDLDR